MAKKATFADALATKTPPASPPAPAPTAAALASAKPTEERIATTVRIEPEKLAALKVIAAHNRGKRVNDLILEGVDHVLALYGAKH